MGARPAWLRSAWVRHGLGLGAAALGVGLLWVLPGLGEGARFAVFAPLVAAVAWWGGRGPGVLATGAAALGVAALFEVPDGLLRGDVGGWVRVTAFVLGHGALVWLVGALRREKARAEALAAAQEEFVRLVGHELRTPLAALQLRLGLELRRLERPGAADCGPVRDGLVASAHQVHRLGRLLGRLLDAARLETGKLVLAREPTDLAATASRAVASARLIDRRHRIVLRAPAAAWAEVDPARVEQVLTNLLDNAIRFGPRGSTIEVEVAEEGGGVRLGVRDAGPGVPEGGRARLFERGAQAHGEGHAGRSGVGL
jgi:signal transduction histidine kinase